MKHLLCREMLLSEKNGYKESKCLMMTATYKASFFFGGKYYATLMECFSLFVCLFICLFVMDTSLVLEHILTIFLSSGNYTNFNIA